jgi:hypothetical protein
VTVNVAACVEDTESDSSYGGGVVLNYTYANPGNGFDYYFTSLSGNGTARQSESSSDSEFYQGSSSAGSCTCGSQGACLNASNGPDSGSWTVPSGVSFVSIEVAGAGGGGGGGGALESGGSGGSGAFGSLGVSVSPGQRFTWTFGGGGQGGGRCGGGNTPNNGGSGCFAGPGWPTRVFNNDGRQIIAAGGGGGGGRAIDGDPGFGSVDPGGSMSAGAAGNGGSGGAAGSFSFRGIITCAGQNGGPGGPGYVEFSYTVNIEGASWSTLTNAINQQFRTSFGRPPSISEMDFWIDQYTSFNIDSISQLRSRISTSGAYRSSTGAISYCGKTL